MRVLGRLVHGDARRPASRAALAALGVVLALALALPYLLGAFQVGLATQILLFGVWALSLNVLAGATGLVSLGHAGLLGVAAYTVAIAQGRWNWSFWAAAAVAVVVAEVVAVVFATMLTRVRGVSFLMVTLAQGMLVYGVAQRWVSVTDGDNGLRSTTRPEALQPYYAYYWFTLGVALAAVLALRWFLTSPQGLRLRGLRDSSTRMASLGYSTARERIVAFSVAGLFAGVAGVLYAGYFGFVSPTTVFLRQSVEGVLMIILGGVQAFLGPLVGAAAVIAARSTISGYTNRWPAFMGLLLIATVLFAPGGLTGLLGALARRLHPRRVPAPADRERDAVVGEGDAPPGILSADTPSRG